MGIPYVAGEGKAYCKKGKPRQSLEHVMICAKFIILYDTLF